MKISEFQWNSEIDILILNSWSRWFSIELILEHLIGTFKWTYDIFI